MNTAVYTCIAGQYDDLKPHPDIPGVDWICFSDDLMKHPAWDIRICRLSPKEPRMRAKYHKLFPDRVLPEYDTTIWIDGSVTVKSEWFAADCTAAMGDRNLALFVHPERDCIYDEAVASLDMRKYRDAEVLNQASYYWALGHPRHWGLWAGGIIARRQTTPIKTMMTAWWHDIVTWGWQDQISLPFVLRNAELSSPGIIGGNLYSNSLLTVDFAGHKSDL